MLQELTVENVAIIERACLTLGPGFTALTGETGAGKSLVVDALELALGSRADSDLVRAGADKATVSLAVDIASHATALAKCAEIGVDAEGGMLVIQRDVSREGRSFARANGRPIAIGSLRELGSLLVDLHGQHDHQSLLSVERQREFFDAWIGEPALALVAEVSDAFHRVESLRRQLEAIRTGAREREQRVDTLRFQIAEIEAVAPRIGEIERLETSLSRMQHAEKLAQHAAAAGATLSEDEGSAEERLGAAMKAIEAGLTLDPSLEPALKHLREALYSAQEASRELRTYLESLDLDADALRDAADRQDVLKRLIRKYGPDEAAVLEYLEASTQALGELEGAGASEEEVASLLDEAESTLTHLCSQLSILRKSRAEPFEREVSGHLGDLALAKARFQVQIQPCEPSPYGADALEFQFTANPGEPLRPLNKVASGGELSRLMLAVKVCLAGKAGVPSLVFDEVDVGLSGHAAAVMARKLADLGRHSQVIVISHLPQIAGLADVHFRVDKGVREGRTVTDLVRLEGDERVGEIARMLAGERVGDKAIANARELLGI